ncbi:C39 family peptidase [Alicyclobacillus sp. SO9]|uniref:C39 family peptidase n=1 Tax=Alicyclobacillus sp. SO9 TaxID=2665646 RepID=UPI0018E8A4E4|nr:C39 family peptidase [Alicyclobacillus sp. SO9]QQE80177.1 C39 family peptidase [Alicyclobacillus sp. SO9]
MRNKKRSQKQYKNQVRYAKIQPHARKKPNKSTRRLAVATMTLAVLGGGTTAAWMIHKVSRYNLYNTTATSGNSVTPGQSQANQAGGSTRSGQPPAKAKGQTSGSGGKQTAQGTGGQKVGTQSGKTGSPSSIPPGTVTDKISGGTTIKPKDGDKPKPHDNPLPNKQEILQKMMKDPLPSEALLRVPAMSQLPQLENGCEVTSLSMLLTFEKHPVSKMTLAKEEPQDKTPLVRKNKKFISWGNPNVGFVGSVSGKNNLGYSIYHGPLTKLVNEILPDRGLDLTGMPFTDLEAVVAGGTPVEVWDTINFQPTNSWVTWKSPEGTVKATWFEHAVLLVGYNKKYVWINNPHNGKAAQKVPIGPFMKAWHQLGEQAITVAPEKFKN